MNKLFFFLSLLLGLSSCVTSVEHVDEQPPLEERDFTFNVETIVRENPAVKVGPIQSIVVEQKIKCTGRIEIPPSDMVSVHSKNKGTVEQINFLPGDYVKKGALLLTIQDPGLVVKQRVLLETKAELELAEKVLERQKILKNEDATSQKAFDEKLAAKALLDARYHGLKSELDLLGIDVPSLENEKKFQSKLFLYAPTSGNVHEVLVNRGQMIEPHDKLMDIANNNHVHLELQVLAKDVPSLEKGQKVEFTLPNNLRNYNAEIIKINPMIDDATGTLKVHCHLEKGLEKQMKAGMFVNAAIAVEAQNLEGLPLEAVVKEGENYFAYVVEQGELIKTGLERVKPHGDFITFSPLENKEMVIAGAYYLE